MARWIGICGERLTPLAQALKDFILGRSRDSEAEKLSPLG